MTYKEILNQVIEEEAERIVMAQGRMVDYIRYVAPWYDMQWYGEYICDHLDGVSAGHIKKLMVTMGPRHGKSELITRQYPQKYLGDNPTYPVLNTTHNDFVAKRNGADFIRNIKSRLPGLVYPHLSEMTKESMNNIQFGSGAEIIFSTVGKGIAGVGFKLGIVDDYFGTPADAASEVKRQAIIEWYDKVFERRMEGQDAAIIVLCTPWHNGDLIGELTRRTEVGDDDFLILNIQAERTPQVVIPGDPREVGEYLWESKFGRNMYDKVKKNSPDAWQTQYQGITVKEGGEVAKAEWFPLKGLEQIYLMMAREPKMPVVHFLGDTGDSAKDANTTAYTVYWAVAVIGGRAWVIDEFRERGRFHDLKEELKEFIDLYRGNESMVYTENKSTGATYTNELLASGYNAMLYDVPSGRNALSKDERFISAMHEMKAGRLGFSDQAKPAISELTSWPKGAYKDRCDVAGMVVNILLRNDGASEFVPGGRLRLGSVRNIR